MIYKHGIDISNHQGDIDLKPYKDNFIIIRVSFSTTEDKRAKRNMDLCEKLGIPYGVYVYSYSLTVAEAIKEAKFLLKLIKDRNIRCGVWYDMEDADGYKRKHGFPSNDTITNMCNSFCKTIADAGYYVGVYASQSWFGTKIKSSMKYPKWIASWGTNNGKRQSDLSSKCVIHQYTSKPLDKDVMYVPMSTFSKKGDSSPEKKEDKTPVKKKSVTEIAKEVIAGKWGNGDERKKKIEKAGYNYEEVQKKVNELLKKDSKKTTKKKSTNTIAKEVIQGKWGNGEERRKKLKKAGYNPDTIQKAVNKMLKK